MQKLESSCSDLKGTWFGLSESVKDLGELLIWVTGAEKDVQHLYCADRTWNGLIHKDY